ncbi:flagellar hook-associated family protein [Bosea sp. PAMC 26642]|uniref:flagellar hook-associated family protein n=1 Tax=Bosea sp. (strain PAMC 26642) TaxID=1792307 RepID=UPI0007705816|nr:flagellar hook-associated family protein [Bosea sp. PAMC 26642]AMJ62661.1 hypothetical protein AXW83_22295 [Bosea sp. PAMC 26642]
MKTTFVSTSAISNMLRGSILKAQDKLIDANKEMVTARFADVGLSIGARTGLTVNIRNQYDRTEGIIDTNGLVAQRLDVTQQALGGLLSSAQSFLTTLIAVRNGEKGASVLVTEATNNLQGTTATANYSMGGQYIFAGINTQQEPMADYFANPPSANKTAIDTAFLGAFGFAQNDPAVSTISAAGMKTFLQTNFANEFADPAWANWSTAVDRNLTSRISPNEIIDVSTNANQPFMRDLAKVYTMVSGLGTQSLNQNAYQTLVDEAITVVNSSIQGLIATQAQLGSAQARVSSASERLTIQRDIMAKQIKSFEDVDPYEAKLRVDALTTQIETSYALTVRFQNMSILNYMR